MNAIYIYITVTNRNPYNGATDNSKLVHIEIVTGKKNPRHKAQGKESGNTFLAYS